MNEVETMATKSITKNVTLRNKVLGRNFVNALEYAQQKANSTPKTFSKQHRDLKGDDIKKLFGDCK